MISVCYRDVTEDNDDFSDGLAGIFGIDRTKSNAAGKIMVWAFAAMRLLDYALTLPSVDPARCCVIGHSRLGKTALVAGMLDPRFSFVCSNDSGCGGASLYRGSLGQTGGAGKYGGPGESLSVTYEKINFRYWYCPNRYRDMEKNYPEGYDQHFLLASIAPRFLLVGSADMDDWADPASEQLCCLAASPAWEAFCVPGLVHCGHVLDKDESLDEGHIAYHRRSGTHFLSVRDWEFYMDYMDKQKK